MNETEMIYETVTNQLLVDARDIANYHLFDIDSLHVNSRFSVDNSNALLNASICLYCFPLFDEKRPTLSLNSSM